jgi:hypothetical protein
MPVGDLERSTGATGSHALWLCIARASAYFLEIAAMLRIRDARACDRRHHAVMTASGRWA